MLVAAGVAVATAAAAAVTAAANALPLALVRVLTNTVEQRTEHQVPLDQSLASRIRGVSVANVRVL